MCCNRFRVISSLIVLSATSFVALGAQRVKISPAPKGVELSRNFIIENVLFDNVVLDGRKVTAENVTMNEFVKHVRFE